MTADILRELADAAKERVRVSKEMISLDEIKAKAESMPPLEGSPFEKAISAPGMSFICECKRASPSKGMISKEFPYIEIAKEYEEAGASAISVLTEPTRFLGSNAYLREISSAVGIPCLRKDFIVDEYMIYEARCLGASAVLLICSILSPDEMKRFIRITEDLGMSALCEAHDADEMAMAIDAGARIIGVNNRNLRDFTVDINTCIRLRHLAPSSVLFVAESGITSRKDIRKLEKEGVDAVLIGETLMRSDDRKAKLMELRGMP